jgi:hypothetical protein
VSAVVVLLHMFEEFDYVVLVCSIKYELRAMRYVPL